MPHDVETRRLQRPGCSVRYLYRPSRDGRWVVFLHGAGADAESFTPQLVAVPAGVGILAWDARGHGLSQLAPETPFRYWDMVDDLYALLDEHGVATADFVGQSMGGNLAQTITRRSANRVRKLVLIDCTDNFRQLWPAEQIGLALSRATLRVWPWWGIVAATALSCGVTPWTQAYTVQAMHHLGKQHFLEVMDYWSDAHMDDSHPLGRPTLLVLGAFDMTGNIAYAMSIWPLKDPMAKLFVVPFAAHMSNRDQPWLVNQALKTFLDWGAKPSPAVDTRSGTGTGVGPENGTGEG